MTRKEGTGHAEDGVLALKQKIPKFRFRPSGKGSILMAILAALLFLWVSFLVYVRPNEFGIKVVRIGLNRGVQEQPYPTGLHLVIPFGFQQMHRLPRDIQVLELTNFKPTATGSWTRTSYSRRSAPGNSTSTTGSSRRPSPP